jgi:hypothetical protein
MSVGKTRPEVPTKVSMPRAVRPVAQRLRTEGVEQWLQFGAAFAVTRDEAVVGFGVGDVHAALAGEQELARHRRHGVEEFNAQAGRGQHLGGHQPGGAAADDGDLRSGVLGHGDCKRHSSGPSQQA